MNSLRHAVVAFFLLCAAGGAHAQIVFRAAAQAGVASTGSIAHAGAGGFGGANVSNGCPSSISPPTPGGAVGELLLALVVSKDSATLSASAGWNTMFAQNPVANYQSAIYWRVRDGTGSDNLTVSKVGAGCDVMVGRMASFSGVDPVDPILSVTPSTQIPAANWSYQNSNQVVTGTETTIAPEAMLLFAGLIGDNRTTGNPAGFSESFDSGTGTGTDAQVVLKYRLETTAGPKGPFSQNKGGGSDPNHGVLFALNPSGLRIAVPGGTAVNDVMIASIAARPCSGTSGAACTTIITPPAGWTLVNSFDQTTGGGTGGFGNIMYIYRRVATGAEPASYSWTFAGTPANNGAVGGIMSFSGVDPTNPVVVDAGQVTPLAPTHTAPSINTGTETNTMLVGSFAASSSATWTPPGGMTEAVDVPSLTVPNALGLSIEMAYELRAAAGATGTRTATQSSPPADDTGAAHLLALRPAVTVQHYAISFVSTTVANCDFAEVTITAHNAGHVGVNPPSSRAVTLSVSAGAATAVWQPTLVVGTGGWVPAGATATYLWPGNEPTFTVRLRQSAVVSFTVNANDTFVTETLAEDPTISFVNSAFRVSDGANAALAIGNQIAAKPSNTGVGTQSLFLQAIRTDTLTGACTSIFPSGSEVDIDVGAQCNNPAACTQNVTLTTTSGTGSPTGNFVPAGAGTYPATIRFRFSTANAEAPFFFSYADAGQITLQFRHITAAPAVTITGTSNAFVTRPFAIAFRGANDATAIQHGTLPTSGLLAAAGDNFTMTLAAYRWVGAEDDGTGNPLPGADITDNGLTPNFASSTTVSATGNLPGVATGAAARGVGCAGAATIAAGDWAGGAATIGDWCYDEVGNAFFGAAAANYIVAGVNVSGNSGLDGTGAAGGFVGRFKPKHFTVTGAPTLANRSGLACAPPSSFTYMNEALSLGFTLEARNTQNVLTQNYTGAYAKLNLATAADLGIGALSGATNLTPRVDLGLAPTGSFTNGSAALLAGTGISRATPDTPDGPYTATQFGIAPNDNDPNPAGGVQMGSFDLDVDGVGGNDHFAIAPTTELRFGRLRLQNGFGPDSVGLQIPLDLQYWNGSGFAVNNLDSCTTLARSDIALSFTGPIDTPVCNTAVLEANIPFALGVGKLTLAAPGAGETGFVLLTPQLGTAAGTYCPAKGAGTAPATASPAIYLLGRWDDAADPDANANTAYDDKPTGRATFGLYGSQPKNFIFFRENY